jgi:hypothetical protein
MIRNNVRQVLVIACALVGCVSSHATSQDDGDTQASGGTVGGATSEAVTAKAGFYSANNAAQSARWVQAMNLHGDGTYEATFGNGELSGFLFSADGTFTVDDSASTIAFSYTYGSTGTDVYNFKPAPDGLQLEFVSADDQADQAYVTLTKGDRPQSLEFDAQGAPTQSGALVAGSPLLIEYASVRDQCPASASLLQSPVTMLIVVDGAFGQQNLLQFPIRPIDGYYRGLMSVPSGHELNLWFEDDAFDSSGNVTCQDYDSNNAQNFNFEITGS